MMLIEETTLPDAALPVAEYRAHLRLGTGFADGDLQDPVLGGFLRAAMAAIEARTGKVLIERAFSWTLTRWRDAAGQPLPVAPVREVTRLALRNRDEEEEVIAPAMYRLEPDAHRPVLRPAGNMLPAVPEGGVAEVQLSAGFAADWAGMPADLAQAVLLLAGHYYEYRHETALSEGCMPFGVTSLIERYRTVRLMAGGGA
jgi:uncharacterized phiE125 gp8 family phage protein